MKFTAPKANDKFTISSAPAWPSIAFETDGTGPHEWQWSITWKQFKKSGVARTAGNKWDAKADVTNCGGLLTVTVHAEEAAKAAGGKPIKVVDTISVKIIGTNPSNAEANAYLTTKPDSKGFDKILEQEAKFKHFKNDEPIKSFDNGFGMCQLTTPTPKFEQVWNWNLNIDGGLALFALKRASALAYLSQSSRSYTADQLTYESVCRWNGGSYHVWDAAAGAWARSSTIMCDTKTGNMGWDMTRAANKGKTEDELHKRDSGTYNAPPAADADWKYSGICYADHVLG
jgi:hypothetical protein